MDEAADSDDGRKRRSTLMSRIRAHDTAPEMRVRRAAHALGLRFRLHQSGLPGRPDMVLARHRTVILVHGCFWHRHAGCRRASTPRTNVAFWNAKFARNVARDARDVGLLKDAGWRVIVVWECETRDATALSRRLALDFGIVKTPGE